MKPQPSAPSAAAPFVVKNYDTAQAEALGPLSLAVLLATLSFCESLFALTCGRQDFAPIERPVSVYEAYWLPFL